VIGDDVGRGTFADDSRNAPPKDSVFAAVDQKMIIEHLDDVRDDDLSSSFFSHSIQDVEDAAANVFDIGIRTLTVDARPTDEGRAFGKVSTATSFAPPAQAAVPPPDVAPPLPQTAAQAAAGLEEARRRAFILGGPAAAH
jgi:hypothetical protein